MQIEPLVRYIGLEVPQGQLHEKGRPLEALRVDALPYEHLYDGQPSYDLADLHEVQPAAVAMRDPVAVGHHRGGLQVGSLAITSFEVQATGSLSASVTASTARLYHQLLAAEVVTTGHPEWFTGFEVMWGDGAGSDTTDPGLDGLQPAFTHTYQSAGEYPITLTLYLVGGLSFVWDRYPRATRQVTVS